MPRQGEDRKGGGANKEKLLRFACPSVGYDTVPPWLKKVAISHTKCDYLQKGCLITVTDYTSF